MSPNSQNIISPIPPVHDLLRKDIDWIDDQILDLLEQRYAVVKRVAWAKIREADQALAVRPSREAAILERLSSRAIHVPEADVSQIWRAILSLSAHHQRAYRVLVWGSEEARPALLALATARHPGVTVEWTCDGVEAAGAASRGEAILMIDADQRNQVQALGLDLLGQHETGCIDHPWALELGRLGADEKCRAGWSAQSWRDKVHHQLPAYPDQRLVRSTEQKLRERDAIVPLEEVLALRSLLARAQQGRAMLVQAGDCAERIDASHADIVAAAELVGWLGDKLEVRQD